MPYRKVGIESSADIEMHDNDHGAGTPEKLNAALPDLLGR
jgi:hypothetical protein